MMEQAIIINMPIDMFWDDEPEFYNVYVKAYQRTSKERINELNTSMWLAGVYVQRAIISSLDGKHHKYPNKPMDCFKSNRELTPQEEQAEMLNTYNKLLSWSAGFKGKFSKDTK